MKLEYIYLIDDDIPTNFIHERIIEGSGVEAKVHVFEGGALALEYLNQNSIDSKPGIIFLDINMPGMDGWEFLDQYEKLPQEQRSKIILVILSTSINPDDKYKSEQRASVDSFLSKPLKNEDIDLLVSKHFAR